MNAYDISIEQIALLKAFGSWGAASCFFAALALVAIWWHIGKKTNDFGQVYLAISVALWGVSGVIEVISATTISEIKAAGGDPSAIVFRLAGWKSVLSLANSLFILLALPWFRYIPYRLAPLIKSKLWPLIVALPFVVAILPTIRQLLVGENNPLVSELDVYYALLTLAFLGAVLWSSFARRRLPTLAYLTALAMVVTVGAQVLKLGAEPGTQLVLAAIFKTCLIMMFFALALSWVRELAETAHPVLAKALTLTLLGKRQIEIGGFAPQVHSEAQSSTFLETTKLLQLSPAHYELLFRFAERRKNNPLEGWLEIKPKSETRTRRTYDIRDHNEVRRLLHALLDGMYGAGNWAREQHELPLKHVLFETDEAMPRMIRLALPTSAVTLANTEVSSFRQA